MDWQDQTIDWRDAAENSQESARFWQEASRWPRDLGDMVFLARAIREVGKSKFDADWPDDCSPHSPDKSVKLFLEAADAMVMALAEGRLGYALRAKSGGAFHDGLEAHRWNSETAIRRFFMCQMDDRTGGRMAMEPSWIFISKSTMDVFLCKPPVEISHDDQYMPPYIRLMMTVVREHGITPDNQPTKDEVVLWLLETSKRPNFPTLSPTLARYAATLVREFEAQSGTKFHSEHKARDDG